MTRETNFETSMPVGILLVEESLRKMGARAHKDYDLYGAVTKGPVFRTGSGGTVPDHTVKQTLHTHDSNPKYERDGVAVVVTFVTPRRNGKVQDA